MTKREREIYFLGFVQAMGCYRAGNAEHFAKLLILQWNLPRDPEQGLSPEIEAELRATGVIIDAEL